MFYVVNKAEGFYYIPPVHIKSLAFLKAIELMLTSGVLGWGISEGIGDIIDLKEVEAPTLWNENEKQEETNFCESLGLTPFDGYVAISPQDIPF